MEKEVIESELVDLRLNGGPFAFKNLSAGQVTAGIRERAGEKAYLIDQAGTSLCGPACFIYWVASDMPRVYAKYIQDLFRTGKGRIGDLTVEPSTSCKNFDPQVESGDLEVPHPTDWIALASLRDSSNLFRAYDEVDDEVAGITMPRTLQSWFKKAGYRDSVNTTIEKNRRGDVYSHQRLEDLKEASRLVQNGYRVNLLIDGKMLNGNQGSSWLPNHWVALLAPVDFRETSGGSSLDAQIYTWGRKRRFTTSVDVFLGNFWGLVAAR